MSAVRAHAALLLAALLSVGTAAAQEDAAAVPAPPRLALEAFPADARAAIEAAVADASRLPRDPAAAGRVALTLHAWEQWEAAHVAYQRAQRLAPDTADWWYLDGMVLQRLVRVTEAATALAQAARLAPTSVPARARLAEVLFGAGDLDASARAYQSLASDPVAASVGEFGLGRIAARRGRHIEAVAHFERAVALFPEFGAAYYGLAQSLRALGRRDQALAAVEQHRRFGARWPAIEDPLAAGVSAVRNDPLGELSRGLRLAESGDLAGAIEAHEGALARNPALAQAHVNLISLYGRIEQWAKAEAHHRAALAVGYNVDEAHYNYGVLLGQQRRWKDAEAAYRLAIGANPLHARARNNLGQLLEAERRLDGAMDEYRQAIAASPQLRIARYNLARMLLAARRYDAAIAEFEQLREPQDAESPRYWYGLAVAQVQAGRREAGLGVAREAHRLAVAFGQRELAAAIERDIASLR